MDQLEFSSDVTVKLVRAMASDDNVVQAAQVSVKGENNPKTDLPRLINYLISSRHGSPFEHSVFTFFVEAPIFVFREWHRHRMSSINEMSGRYTVLKPKFYTPGATRKMQNVGSSARPEFAPGSSYQQQLQYDTDKLVARQAWDAYTKRLDAGIANELARTVLPVSVYSQMYWTVNARGLMNFLSLRIDAGDEALFRSRPQREIEMGAEKMETIFAELMPTTHAAFVASKRVAP